MFGWSNRPTHVEPRHMVGGERPAAVYTIGKYEVTVTTGLGDVAALDLDVTYRVPSSYYQPSDPRATLPNMSVEDGELRFPITDLIDMIMSRISPDELAVELCADPAVRTRLLEVLADQWSQDNIGDADRRAFLVKVQSAVHSAAIDKLVGSLASAEERAGYRYHVRSEIARINRVLLESDVRVPVYRCASAGTARPEDAEPETEVLQFIDEGGAVKLPDGSTRPGLFETISQNWCEARQYWRAEAARLLVGPDQATRDAGGEIV